MLCQTAGAMRIWDVSRATFKGLDKSVRRVVAELNSLVLDRQPGRSCGRSAESNLEATCSFEGICRARSSVARDLSVAIESQSFTTRLQAV